MRKLLPVTDQSNVVARQAAQAAVPAMTPAVIPVPAQVAPAGIGKVRRNPRPKFLAAKQSSKVITRVRR